MRFRHFEVDQTGVLHKVGEESVLFASWIDLANTSSILDVGTGTGILALIAAQRSSASITALERDNDSFKCAQRNFQQSKFSGRIESVLADVLDFPSRHVDHIITNPPYFAGQVLSPSWGRNQARQDEGFSNWLAAFTTWCSTETRLSVIWPSTRRGELMAAALASGWHRNREASLRSTAYKAAHRCMVTFARTPKVGVEIEEITVREQSGDYHLSFTQYTQDTYL